jgi:hypothetical protein
MRMFKPLMSGVKVKMAMIFTVFLAVLFVMPLKNQ